MRIDVHTHAQPPEFYEALRDCGRYEIVQDPDGRSVVREKGSRFLTVTPQMHDPAQRVADMDAAGVDLQVLSVSTPQVYFLEGQAQVDLAMRCNDYLAGIVQQYPERFRALASVPLTADIDVAMAELARCMDQLGMPGFIIGANVDGIPIDDPRFDPFYEEANRRNALMFIHPMVPPGVEAMNPYALAPLVGFMFDTTLALSRLIFSDFFGRFLGINVWAGHLGGALPFLAGRLDMGYRNYPDCQGVNRPPSEIIERISFDTVSSHEAALRCAIETVGEDRILFGSDYPQVIGNIQGAIDTIEHSVGRRHRGRILGDNAAQLLGLA